MQKYVIQSFVAKPGCFYKNFSSFLQFSSAHQNQKKQLAEAWIQFPDPFRTTPHP